MTTLREILNEGRRLRGFSAEKYVFDKMERINNFFTDNNLDSVVLGLSGGIDSSLVLALLLHASMQPGSPLKNIDALAMPIYGDGVTGQMEAVKKAEDIVNILLQNYLMNSEEGVLQFSVVDLTKAYEAYNVKGRFETNQWARGQLASIVRTPYLYFRAAILQQRGYRSVVCGTTNRDEGAYIGFFGKASDGMVDIQPIADLHKSEVYLVSELLDIPKYYRRLPPQGDVWDARTDEEMIGAPYEFLEMYQLAMEYNLGHMYSELSPNEYGRFNQFSGNIEHLHVVNNHKYQVGSPSHFLDVMNRKIPGGWQ